MVSIRGKAIGAFGKVFGENEKAYKVAKKVYQTGVKIKGYNPKKNRKSLEGPVAIIRVNADFSENGAKILKKLIKKYKIKPILAVKMVDVVEDKKWQRIAKDLEKAGCELALHGYHHSKKLPLLSGKQKEEEISLAVSSFKKYFKKSPKGFFASRNAYDIQSLHMLKKYGIKYYAEMNNLYPEKHRGVWDICLNRKLFDPLDWSLIPMSDHIIKRKGTLSVCWHLDKMRPNTVHLFEEYLDYLKENKIKTINLSMLGRRLK
jgi:hypothetical protein